jgi:serine protease Do
MKKVIVAAAVLGFTALGFTAQAQEEKVEIEERKEQREVKERPEIKEKKETQEIIIRKKGDKDAKISIEIKGDNVTINGKPLSDFKDGEITINKRNIRIFDGNNNFSFSDGDDIEMLLNRQDIGSIRRAIESKPRAFLGITTNAKTDDGDEPQTAAVEITGVTKGSAAEKAGLKEGDIITKIDDAKVTTPADLSEAIAKHKPNNEVTVQYSRNGKVMTAKAKLGETKTPRGMAYSFSGPDRLARAYTVPRMPAMPNMPPMARIEPMPNFDWKMDGDIDGNQFYGNGAYGFPRQQKLGLKIQDTEEGSGVKVLSTEKDSPAEKVGLQKDDVVTEIGGVKINNTDDAREQLQQNAEKATYNIKAKRNGKEMSFDIKIPKKLKTANL